MGLDGVIGPEWQLKIIRGACLPSKVKKDKFWLITLPGSGSIGEHLINQITIFNLSIMCYGSGDGMYHKQIDPARSWCSVTDNKIMEDHDAPCIGSDTSAVPGTGRFVFIRIGEDAAGSCVRGDPFVGGIPFSLKRWEVTRFSRIQFFSYFPLTKGSPCTHSQRFVIIEISRKRQLILLRRLAFVWFWKLQRHLWGVKIFSVKHPVYFIT